MIIKLICHVAAIAWHDSRKKWVGDQRVQRMAKDPIIRYFLVTKLLGYNGVSWYYSKKFTLCSLQYSCLHSQVYIVIKKLMIVREIFHYKQSICLENFQMEVKVGVCNCHNTYKIYE